MPRPGETDSGAARLPLPTRIAHFSQPREPYSCLPEAHSRSTTEPPIRKEDYSPIFRLFRRLFRPATTERATIKMRIYLSPRAVRTSVTAAALTRCAPAGSDKGRVTMLQRPVVFLAALVRMTAPEVVLPVLPLGQFRRGHAQLGGRLAF